VWEVITFAGRPVGDRIRLPQILRIVDWYCGLFEAERLAKAATHPWSRRPAKFDTACLWDDLIGRPLLKLPRARKQAVLATDAISWLWAYLLAH
jgi:hypothetical protein